jgi:hypothetical protein
MRVHGMAWHGMGVWKHFWEMQLTANMVNAFANRPST